MSLLTAHRRKVTVATDGRHPGDDHAPPACEQFCADDIPLLATLKSLHPVNPYRRVGSACSLH